MDKTTEKLIKATKKELKIRTGCLYRAINSIKALSDANFIQEFDRYLAYNWSELEKKYFDEEVLKAKILADTGYFDYAEHSSEVNEYVRALVEYLALINYEGDEP